MFQLAVDRGQIDENPFGRIKPPKFSRKKIRIFSQDECRRVLQASKEFQDARRLRWDILIVMALVTGMRRGELLNCI
jgi:site-specific recombinase XerD